MGMSTQRFDMEEVLPHINALNDAVNNICDAINSSGALVSSVREKTIGKNAAIEALDNMLSETAPKLKAMPEAISALRRDLATWNRELEEASDASVLGL